MAGKLVTIATFDRVLDAQFARGALESAGIKVAIVEEDTSPIIGQYLTATSGIKLLVQDEDEEAAVKVLDEAFKDNPLDETDLATQAEAEAPEDPNDAAEQPLVPVSDPIADAAQREKNARFALQSVVLGFVIPFGHLFAVVMIMQACSGPGELSKRGRYHVYAAVLLLAGVYLPLLILVVLLSKS